MHIYGFQFARRSEDPDSEMDDWDVQIVKSIFNIIASPVNHTALEHSIAPEANYTAPAG